MASDGRQRTNESREHVVGRRGRLASAVFVDETHHVEAACRVRSRGKLPLHGIQKMSVHVGERGDGIDTVFASLDTSGPVRVRPGYLPSCLDDGGPVRSIRRFPRAAVIWEE